MLYVEANGARIPALGLGTWELRDDTCRHIVEHALAVGYRHIDTAQMYANEAAVGEALRRSPVARDEIFLTTKIWPDRFADGVLQRAAEESVRRLQVENVDLLLLHWPNPDIDLAETLGALAEVKRRGLARHIGISNFTRALIDQAVRSCPEPLVANQVEYHPYLNQSAVLQAARGHGLAVTAYSPIARGEVLRDPTLQRIGERRGKSPAQVALRWLLQQPMVCAIPRSRNRANVEANIDVFDFELGDDEIRQIHALARPDGRIVNVAGVAPDWDG